MAGAFFGGAFSPAFYIGGDNARSGWWRLMAYQMQEAALKKGKKPTVADVMVPPTKLPKIVERKDGSAVVVEPPMKRKAPTLRIPQPKPVVEPTPQVVAAPVTNSLFEEFRDYITGFVVQPIHVTYNAPRKVVEQVKAAVQQIVEQAKVDDDEEAVLLLLAA